MTHFWETVRYAKYSAVSFGFSFLLAVQQHKKLVASVSSLLILFCSICDIFTGRRVDCGAEYVHGNDNSLSSLHEIHGWGLNDVFTWAAVSTQCSRRTCGIVL